MLVGQRGATRRDRVRDAGERERHHVGVALADHDLTAADDLALRPVQAVEQPALLVDRRLGGVLVLRSVGAERRGRRSRPASPRGRRSGTSAAPRNWSCSLFDLVHEREPGASMSSRDELLLVEVHAQPVPAVGRPPELELARRVAVEPAAAQVAARGRPRRRSSRSVVVVVDRGADRLRRAAASLERSLATAGRRSAA